MRRVRSTLTSAFAAAVLAACAQGGEPTSPGAPLTPPPAPPAPGPDTTSIAAIVVAPANVTLAAGTSQTFAATGRNGAGTAVAAPVRWTATGGVVDTLGRFTAGTAPGSYRVVATIVGGTLADTAAVTVTATAPPAATLTAVVLAPPTVSLATGASQQFTATGSYSDGSSGPVTVTYAATGGTMSAGGRYTAGSTAGTGFRVVATATGGALADTSAVTITLPPVTSCVVAPATASDRKSVV